MRISEILRLVFINIKQNKFKVFLTSLGVIVGAATIVMVIAIGEGGKQDVADQFKNLNAGTITVTASENTSMMGGMPMMDGMPMPSGGGGGGGGGSTRSSGGGGATRSTMMPESTALEQEDLEDVLFFVPDISAGALFAETESSVISENLDEAITYDIVATESSYQQISNLNVEIGSFITEDEVENVTKSVVLGYDVALELFGSSYLAYDSTVEIDGRSYIVNGVLSQMGSVTSGISPDNTIFMPYSTAEKYLLSRDTAPKISLLASDVDSVPTVIENVNLVLTQSNPDSSFTIEDAGATMDAATDSANTLSTLLLAVAAIVFIVGGIGIMNVLFVSVKERTREIGVLKAIGTKKGDILLLFLFEAAMIGFIGGAIGVLLSFAIMPLMQYTDMTVVMTAESVILAFAFAVFTGTTFGFYPAFKASNLVPIQALNNE